MDSNRSELEPLVNELGLSGVVRKYHDRFLADDSFSDADCILLAVYLIEHKNNKTGAPYAESKRLFVSLGRREIAFGKRVYTVKKEGYLDGEKEFTLSMKGLKHLEKILGKTEKTPIRIIRAGTNYSALKLFEEFLHSEIKDNEILLVDSHISPITLHPFSILKDKITAIKLLTSNIYEAEKFLDNLALFEKETKIKVEVKKSFKIHDRWLVCGEKCWSIGTSIKDLGNKDTLLVELPGVTASLADLFDNRWKEATII